MTLDLKTRVRPADTSDFDDIMVMSRIFWESLDYEEPFDPQHVRALTEALYRQELLVVLDVDGRAVGVAAATKAPLAGTGSVFVACEVMYYIDPEYRGHGVALLQGLEQAARLAGARYLAMVSLQCSAPKVAETVYARLGYQHVESTWRKRIQQWQQ